MLTKLIVRDFKGLTDVEIDLDNPVVFVGPNDSGKTSALQAITLWELGLRRCALPGSHPYVSGRGRRAFPPSRPPPVPR